MQEFSGPCNPSRRELNSNQLTAVMWPAGQLPWAGPQPAQPPVPPPACPRGQRVRQRPVLPSLLVYPVPNSCCLDPPYGRDGLCVISFQLRGASLSGEGHFEIAASALVGSRGLLLFLHFTSAMQPHGSGAAARCGVCCAGQELLSVGVRGAGAVPPQLCSIKL